MADNSRFFNKSVLNSLRFSFSRVSVIFVSLFIGACVSSAFLNISFDIESKLSNELKVYGANFIISPASGQNRIDERKYNAKIAQIPKDKLKSAAPFLYGFFSLGSNSAIVAGVDFSAFKGIYPFIEVREGHFGESVFSENSAFVGVSLAKSAELKVGDTITITNQKNLNSADLEIKGIISSGDEIDGILLAPLKVVQNLTGNSADSTQDSSDSSNLPLDKHSADSANFERSQTASLVSRPKFAENSESLAENASVVLGDKESAESSNDSTRDSANFIHFAKLILYGNFDEVRAIGEALSDEKIAAKPIAQVSISEGVVLSKIKSLMILICLIILLIASLSVNTSLSSIIFARKKEVALHLSLGARKSQIARLFGAEVLLLALVSSLLGALCGYLLANLLGFIIFNSSISFRFLSIVCAVLITLFFACLASFYPIKKALNINITTNLKGE